jgi:hypothetical protein
VFVLAGAQAPESLRIEIANADLEGAPLDLSTVSQVDFLVVKPSGERVIWATTITAQSTTALNADHSFALNDVLIAGFYQIDVRLTVPGGVRRAGPTTLEVRECG